ncbi:MAG: hypothetical protein DYG98_08790 [Haliscomenobacteraceae bacterium CHB4]|nr:hypothetical protein [Haliscomenobacteraceae bacterium CHB4]
MVGKDFNQIIQIVNGNFSPVEAREMLNELITSRINFHNIQMLKRWEANHRYDPSEDDKKINAMRKGKAEAIELIEKAKREGFNIEIIGDIKVKLSK